MRKNSEIVIESKAEETMLPDPECDPEPSPLLHESVEVNRHERISLLAYRHFERRGRIDGHDVDDWLAAEQELIEMERGTVDFPH
jgi:hypothetical protein